MSDGAGDLRDEAERLVSAALAAASFAVRGAKDSGLLGGRHVSTGTPECCVCPVCRGIAAVRNPSPELVFTVAKGATSVAGGVASVLRAFSAAAPKPAPPRTPRDSGATWRSATRVDDPPAPADEPPPADEDPWSAATRAGE
jgi:hypothetical protein